MKEAVVCQLPLQSDYVFRSYSDTLPIDRNDYVGVWRELYASEEDNLKICDNLFSEFNSYRPKHFAGHSLSVSDIIFIYDDETDIEIAYYCDSIGWKQLTGF